MYLLGFALSISYWVCLSIYFFLKLTLTNFVDHLPLTNSLDYDRSNCPYQKFYIWEKSRVKCFKSPRSQAFRKYRQASSDQEIKWIKKKLTDLILIFQFFKENKWKRTKYHNFHMDGKSWKQFDRLPESMKAIRSPAEIGLSPAQVGDRVQDDAYRNC